MQNLLHMFLYTACYPSKTFKHWVLLWALMYLHIYTSIYIYIYTCVYICIKHIYIYRERERESDRQRQTETDRQTEIVSLFDTLCTRWVRPRGINYLSLR